MEIRENNEMQLPEQQASSTQAAKEKSRVLN